MAMKVFQGLFKVPEILIYNRFSYLSEGIPVIVNNLSGPQKINLLKCGLNIMLHKTQASYFPTTLQIEPVNICDLKCDLCPAGNGAMKRQKGFMSMETFNKILHELGDYLITMFLFGWGEPFLNKNLPDMIKACTARNISTITSTNGQTIQTIEEALAIVDAKLTGLIIAIDGSTQDIYSFYRKNGDLEKVKNCAALIEEAKSKRRSKYPYTNIRIVVNKENMEDIREVEKLAKNIGVNMFSSRGICCSNGNNEEFENFHPDGTDKSIHNKNKTELFKCIYPFRRPTILWDGTIVSCDVDYEKEAPWGTIGEEKFMDIWNNTRAIKLRKNILTGRGNRPDYCYHCPFGKFKDKRDDCIISFKELRPADRNS